MKMKLRALPQVLALLFLATSLFAQKSDSSDQFKVIGYYYWEGAMYDSIPDTSYSFLDKLTHVNIAFINPDSTGHFHTDFPIRGLIKKAHNKKVKVLASIAGGGSHGYYHALLSDSLRSSFIDNLLKVVEAYKFDGVDVDIEWEDISDNYEKFIVELAARLKQNNLLITAAISTGYSDRLTDKALSLFDFVNIMSYDLTGPWRPQDPGDHSPYSMAESDLNFWHVTRHLPKEKLVLGLPFYGYGFGPDSTSTVVSLGYKDVAALYPESVSDTVSLGQNVMFYFNNAATIRRKTALALEKGGGVMIWQVAADAPGEKSLLKVIDNTIKAAKNP